MYTKPWGTEWSEALSMSDPEIDAEHKQCLELVERLNSAIAGLQRNRQSVLDIMQRIVESTASHFEHEERLLSDHAYPAKEEHARIHAEIMDRLNQAMRTMRDSGQVRDWTKIAQDVDRLLHEHLEDEDSKYVEFLQTDWNDPGPR
jgi:hemerythrin